MSRSANLAAYRSSVFASHARVDAHATALAYGRAALGRHLGVVSESAVEACRRLAVEALGIEVEAAAAMGTPSTSEAGRLRCASARLARRAEQLARLGPLAAVPCMGRVTLAGGAITEPFDLSSASEAAEAWAEVASDLDQLVLMADGGSSPLIVQLMRPALAREQWPWTVQVTGYAASPARLFAEFRCVSHGGSDVWCHVAPRPPVELGRWLAELLAVLTEPQRPGAARAASPAARPGSARASTRGARPARGTPPAG